MSVVIPVYNGEQYVEGCIRYLREQTLQDVEVIFVVDHKTTDRTADLISESSAGMDVRTVIQNDSLRMGGARNIGLKEASGEYIWFLDVDDRPYPSLLEEMVGIMEGADADVSVFNSVYSNQRDLPEKTYGDYSVKTYTGMEAVYEVGKGRISACPWCKIYRVGYLREKGLDFKTGYCEDFDQTVRAFMHTDRVLYYNKPLYVYYQHGGSLCGGANDDSIAERDVILSGSLGEEVRQIHPDDYGLYCAYMARHVIRSLTRASKAKAMELSKRPELRELLAHKQPDFNAEVLLFKVSPSLYYSLGRRARGRKFSTKDVQLFDPL